MFHVKQPVCAALWRAEVARGGGDVEGVGWRAEAARGRGCRRWGGARRRRGGGDVEGMGARGGGACRLPRTGNCKNVPRETKMPPKTPKNMNRIKIFAITEGNY